MQELIKRTLPQDDALNQAIVNELRSQNWGWFFKIIPKCSSFVIILNLPH
ncbi:cytidine/deoxycytidine deaminase [Haemophilus influenzae]|uniref:Cytidine/deoxycytidine deaminase n=1 Tax=Haemophilus influenzae TaxID=727 RepID=A0A2X1PI38_HAEIF|nr:cytidine/deoxycytidine deaminase [Haemophilus influenzae]